MPDEGKSEYPSDILAVAREAWASKCDKYFASEIRAGIHDDSRKIISIAKVVSDERRRCEEIARSWEATAKKVGQIEGEGVARDIRLCIAAGIPAPPSSTEER